MSEALSLWHGIMDTSGLPPARPLFSDLVRREIENAANNHELTYEDVMLGHRYKHHAHARHEAIWRLRQLFTIDGKRLSYPRIASLLGLANHTSALHGFRAHERRMAARG
jgi:chromosomal replication initiation ATPase DnaA